jgi:hypothetical protein
MDIKVPIMKLLTHPDSEVRSQALLTLQKVMITNWCVSAATSSHKAGNTSKVKKLIRCG